MYIYLQCSRCDYKNILGIRRISIRHFSSNDNTAEKIYQTNTTRFSSGRFKVIIPFKTPSPLLSVSKTLALLQYKALELRLNRNSDLRQQYVNVMQDYLTAGHMKLSPLSEIDNILNYCIPHQCVIWPDSTTTKLCVVFNASARTSSGVSLNKCMYRH